MADFDATVLDYIEHPVFVLEPGADGLPRYAAFNAHARKALGRPLSDILGCTAQDMYPGRLGDIAFQHHRETLLSGTPRTYEIQLPLATGQRLVRTSLRPECDDAGKVIRIFGTSADISGRQILREMQAEVTTITSEMEDFVNLAAHDLRAPMRHVKMVAEMLREDFEDMGDGKLELIDLLEELGEKAMRLIGDVLSHAQATSVTEETVEFEFSALVQELIALLDPMAHCEITFNNAEMCGDRTATQIILRNLIDNAMKHAGRGDGKKLRLDIRVAPEQVGEFSVCVTDNGMGFDDPAMLFLDGGRLRSDSGFGLLGVRRLIHARGGSLTATNLPGGQGAEIRFTLPGKAHPVPALPPRATVQAAAG